MHIIPPSEFDLHEQSSQCKCEPVFEIDDLTGELYWFHIPLSVPFISIDGIGGTDIIPYEHIKKLQKTPKS